MDMTFDNPLVRRTAELVHALSKDLRKIESGIGPTVEDRIEADRIEDWQVTYRLELALTGRVAGRVGKAGGPVTTAPLFLLDDRLGFARTLDGFYLLGRRRA